MTIKQKIRGKNGTFQTVKLTPMKAIRKNCLECVNWQPKEVELCGIPLCPLYYFRSGKRENKPNLKIVK
jgi:hypothetical protein